MKELAVSVTKYTVWAKPVEVKDKEAAAEMAKTHIDNQEKAVIARIRMEQSNTKK